MTCFFSLVFSFLGFCTRVLSALRPSLVRPFEFTCGFLRVCSFCCLVRVRCCWHTVCSGNPNPCLGGNPPVHGVIGVLPRPYGRLPTAQCIEGTAAAPPSSACVDPCRGLWPLLQREQTHLPVGQSVSAGGDTRAKRAVSEVWVGTPVPVDYPCLDGRPLFQQLPRQPSQRSRPVPRAKEKSFSDFFLKYKNKSKSMLEK